MGEHLDFLDIWLVDRFRWRIQNAMNYMTLIFHYLSQNTTINIAIILGLDIVYFGPVIHSYPLLAVHHHVIYNIRYIICFRIWFIPQYKHYTYSFLSYLYFQYTSCITILPRFLSLPVSLYLHYSSSDIQRIPGKIVLLIAP